MPVRIVFGTVPEPHLVALISDSSHAPSSGNVGREPKLEEQEQRVTDCGAKPAKSGPWIRWNDGFLTVTASKNDQATTSNFPPYSVFSSTMPIVQMDTDESRYHHLISTNDEPPDLEVAEIQKIIAQRQSNLSELEIRIAELREMLQSLIERRNHEEKIRSHFRAVVSPVRRLPRDILIEIFLFTRDWRKREYSRFNSIGEFLSDPVGPLPTPSALVITHVCSQWRHIALSAPMLWATINSDYVDPDPSGPEAGPYYDQYLHMWLSRTGTRYPLDITFTGAYFGDHPETSLSWLHPYMHRIRALHLQGSLYGLPSSSFEHLETLRMSDFYLDDHPDDIQVSFPSLRRLIVQGDGELIPDPFIPWPQLTHLILDGQMVDPPMLRDILSQSTALVKLHLGMPEDSATVFTTTDDEHILMPHVETLIIGGGIYWLLACLTLPKLTTLRANLSLWPAALYYAFRSRSSFSLKSLTLDGTMEAADVLNMIRESPTITEIMLGIGIGITPMLISGLASPRTVPHLEYLEICSDVYPVFDANTILDMVTSRDRSGKPAVLEPNTALHVRAFRSQVPKRSWDGQVQRFPSYGRTDLFFFC
ncbi:hypothetical protein Hypma_004098 [Hypsizygus marmoreus]|uniref:Uncharacterized protein n=1 Tax=Hypsizygus marmoreus TaxID=39966 RepID=A0A369K6L2_HYPMA|nr:hypothetical protein Hypma_004098 [Hypsizygus marmoreus]